MNPIKATWILYFQLLIMLFNLSTMTNSDVTGRMFSNFFGTWLDLFQVLFPYTVFWYSVSSTLKHWRWLYISVAFRLWFCYQNITFVAVCDIKSDLNGGTILLHYINSDFIGGTILLHYTNSDFIGGTILLHYINSDFIGGTILLHYINKSYCTLWAG
jgi:hypothetical protein